MADQLSPELLEALRGRIDGNTKSWWIRDVTRSYPWVRAKAIMWFIGSDFGSAVVARDVDGVFYLIDTPTGRDKLARFIDDQYGVRPWNSTGTEKFCAHVISLLKDPRYRILTPAWLASPKVIVDSWLMAGEKSRQALERLCIEPELRMGGGAWTMTFNAMDYNGGVAAWQAEGKLDRFTLAPLSSAPRRPAGTFSYPEEL